MVSLGVFSSPGISCFLNPPLIKDQNRLGLDLDWVTVEVVCSERHLEISDFNQFLSFLYFAHADDVPMSLATSRDAASFESACKLLH